MNQIDNEADASTFMLKVMDFDPNSRSIHPTVPSVREVTDFIIPGERHGAYAMLWNNLTYFGVLANTAMWLYL